MRGMRRWYFTTEFLIFDTNRNKLKVETNLLISRLDLISTIISEEKICVFLFPYGNLLF